MLEVEMKALVWHGTADIRCESVPDPRIEQDRDQAMQIRCGSDRRGHEAIGLPWYLYLV